MKVPKSRASIIGAWRLIHYERSASHKSLDAIDLGANDAILPDGKPFKARLPRGKPWRGRRHMPGGLRLARAPSVPLLMDVL